MKKVVRVKLLPDANVRPVLAETLARCNEAATMAAAVAHHRGITRGWDLRTVTYGDAKALGLSAQPAQCSIRKAFDATKARRANARAGNYGPVGSPRRERIMSKPVRFQPDAAQPYDDRCLSWDHDRRTVSIWTIQGRIRVPFTGKRRHLRELAAHRKGESDLVLKDGQFYLYATCDIPDAPEVTPTGFLGVDLGVSNLAVTSDGTMHGVNDQLRKLREARIAERRALQQVGTRSAKRKLKKKSGREARRMTDLNHCISKTIVAEAERTGRGISLEALSGIRGRVRHRKPQRATFHSWAFAQLAAFIAYKSVGAGVPVQIIDPVYTSQECSRCGHVDRKNRPSQDRFACRSCRMSLHADVNAAINIAHRGDREHRAALVASAA